MELLLKGYLYSKGEIPPRTHQLLRLQTEAAGHGLQLKGFEEELASLSEYYFESRYPDEFVFELNSEQVAKKALAAADRISAAILKQF